jgi:hypothetical protein
LKALFAEQGASKLNVQCVQESNTPVILPCDRARIVNVEARSELVGESESLCMLGHDLGHVLQSEVIDTSIALARQP